MRDVGYKLRKITILLFWFLLLTTYHLQLTASNTGASFLKIGIGARPIGMGSAFTAIADDVSAIHWNPAGLSQLSKREISAQHTEWIVDTKLDFIGYAHPIKSGTISGSIVYLSQGSIEGRDENRKVIESFSATDSLFALSYGNKASQLTSYGISLKLIHQQIEKEIATGIAVDFGLLMRLSAYPVAAGISLQNFGPQMKFISQPYNLPLSITAGIGYSIGTLTVAMDVKQHVYENRTIVSLGTEYWPLSSLSLRAGYLLPLVGKSTNLTDDKLNTINNLTSLGAGFGINIFGIQTDYAFLPYGVLGQTHRVSLSMKF